MFRYYVFLMIVFCLTRPDGFAEEPMHSLAVTARLARDSACSPLIDNTKLVVLIEDADDSYQAVNLRALRLRDASLVVLAGNHDHELLPIFRERLRSYGVDVVSLQEDARLARLNRGFPIRSLSPALVNLQELP